MIDIWNDQLEHFRQHLSNLGAEVNEDSFEQPKTQLVHICELGLIIVYFQQLVG